MIALYSGDIGGPGGFQKIGVMTNGPVCRVIMTLPSLQGEKKQLDVGGDPWKSSGGVPLNAGSGGGGGSWQVELVPAATMTPPIPCARAECMTVFAEIVQGGFAAVVDGAACATVGAAIASRGPAGRIKVAPRPHRLRALFIVPP